MEKSRVYQYPGGARYTLESPATLFIEETHFGIKHNIILSNTQRVEMTPGWHMIIVTPKPVEKFNAISHPLDDLPMPEKPKAEEWEE
jgi:hypothetical protein